MTESSKSPRSVTKSPASGKITKSDDSSLSVEVEEIVVRENVTEYVERDGETIPVTVTKEIRMPLADYDEYERQKQNP